MDLQGAEMALLVASVLLGFGLAWLVSRPDRIRTALIQCERDLGALRTEHATLQARFAAKADELERERLVAAQYQDQVIKERDDSRAKSADLLNQSTRLQAELAAAVASLQQVQVLIQERDAARRELEAERLARGRLQTDYSTLQAETAEKLKAGEEKIELLGQMGKQLKTDFENLANRIFEDKTRTFTQTSKDTVEGLLKPVRDQLTEFKAKVEEVYDKEARDRTSLKTEIDLLHRASLRASTGAEALAKALKGDSKVRGSWGEISLERILEQSGLRRGHEYDAQVSQKNEEGKLLRPDVVVYLPEDKAVVIDSKVSLVSYERYHAAESDEERQAHLQAHVAALRAHLNGLSAKDYQESVGKRSLDLVLMFVPIEPAYLLALEADGTLYSDAFNKKVLLVSPTTLMGTLQIIHNIWRYEYQNRHALDIANRGGALYNQFVLFAESLTDVGSRLDQAKTAYESARARLTSGKGNLVWQIEKLRDLGVKAKKRLDPALLAEANIDPDETGDNPALESPGTQSDKEDITT